MDKKKVQKNNSPQGIMEKLNSTYGKNVKKNIPIKDTNIEDNTDKNNIANMEKQIEEMDAERNELLQKIESITAERNEFEEQLKRRLAEFENFRRRTDKEKNDLLEYGDAKLLSKFIDILDDIKNAEQAANTTDNIAAVQKGLNIVHQKTAKLFEDEGVKLMTINAGDEFNVDFHEALMCQPSELPENQIVMVLQNGYFYKEKVLRYAKVITSAGPEQAQ